MGCCINSRTLLLTSDGHGSGSRSDFCLVQFMGLVVVWRVAWIWWVYDLILGGRGSDL